MLPQLPLRTGNDKVDIELLYSYLSSLADYLPNIVGEAIDPTQGQGGDGALTISDIPTNITYTPNASLSIDGVIFGHIDISLIKPDRAVDVIVQYREQGASNFKVSYSSFSPFRIVSLKVGTQYEIQIAGQAANGSIGPFSPLTTVTIPTNLLSVDTPTGLQIVPTYQSFVLTWIAPIDGVLLEYEVQKADDASFTVNVELHNVDSTYFIYDAGAIGVTKYFRVRAIDRAGQASAYSSAVNATTLNVPNASITYAKIQDVTALKILGRGDPPNGELEELDVDRALVITGTVLRNQWSPGWSVSGISTDRSITGSESLSDVINILGTLVQDLKDTNYLTD